ncbi:hypothetical protein Slin15195_G021930 [Septoria linicola]|uniref:Uncharacterized protein n=1 Tax=Septoria linicola TaxID=215465 RepID=A0A9Q9AG91_9PEZI|nr:hypothetical protein Slin14017_G130400 [Septoria linicola]USW48874.1 hypothetical protein Slin15195_G021930 [Septoria linicola]
MPEKDKLSWLTPKRRRTTGSLKAVPHGQQQMRTVAEEEGLESQTNTASGGSERPSALSRPASQPSVAQVVKSGEGNLFYAYARKTDEAATCYLLTFASVSTASEWWLLIQANFSGCSRPSLQLFSFGQSDLLLRARKHPAFERLKSKWMYTILSGAGSEGIDGAGPAIIPIQDEMGNVLGKSVSGPDDLHQSPRQSKEQDATFEDLEARFERMLRSTERNTEHISKLREHEEKTHHNSSNGYFDTSAMAVHFGKLTDMMARNVEFMENMSKKQFEHEQRLTAALEDVSSRRREDRVDLLQLSAHLDRVNRTLGQTSTARKDSLRSQPAPSIDFTPLTATLEKMQEAIEQNSMLTNKLLDEKSNADAEARYKNQLDLLPISESLARIQEAVEKQNLHTNALLEILRDDKDDSLQAAKANGETLDRILQAQIETKEAVEQTGGEVDFTPVAEHMDAIRETTTENTEQIRNFIELQKTVSPVAATSRATDIDFSPMTDRLDRVHASLEKTTGYFQAQSPGTGDTKFIMSALSSHLSKIQAVTEQNANAIKILRDKQSVPPSLPPPAVAPFMDNKTHDIIYTTNEHLRALTRVLTETRQAELDRKTDIEKDKLLEKRLDATSSQVRELMAGQWDMVNVLRELALSITAKEKGACDHVVIPPPRKVGRKIVGFVYDGKEGMI